MKDEGKHPEDRDEFTREVMKMGGCLVQLPEGGMRVEGASGRAVGEEELGNINVCEGRVRGDRG